MHESDLSAADTGGMNRAFDDLCSEYYPAWLRYHPERAVDIGVYDFAGQLTSYEHDDIGALIVLNQKMLSALEEVSFSQLDAGRQTDFRILKGAITIELHDLEDNDWRYRDPVAYVPVNAIYQLLIHPGNKVPQAIKSRLELIPEYLRGAKQMLSRYPERVVPEWTQTAVTICRRWADFIRDLPRQPGITCVFTHPERLQHLFDSAAVALVDFAHYLEDELLPSAQGKFASGSYRFERLLHERHFLPLDAQQLLAFGERLAAETEQALLAQSELLCGEKNIQQALAMVQAEHPEPSQLLDGYRQKMQAAQQWLKTADIVTVPEEQSLKVLPTPAFLRGLIPFAAYEPPVPQDSRQRGLYYVTTAEDPQQLAEHNVYSMELTSAHEAFPGHHLQFVIANRLNRDNLTRLLNASASLYEGWALYCEQLVIEQGLYNKKEHRFVLLRDRLWRALRVIIDVSIHTGRMSLDEAVQLLVDRLGFAPQQAEAEIRWYSHAAATPLCYALGREMIVQAREKLAPGDPAALCEFHDKLLSQGSIALPLVMQAVFGEDLLADVFEESFKLAVGSRQ